MGITVWTATGSREYEITPEMTLLQILREQGKAQLHAPCGGKGTCGKCTVFRVAPCGGEERVLACRVFPKEGEVYRLPEICEPVTLTTGSPGVEVKADEGLTGYGIACDIGTTTVVCHLTAFPSGARIAALGRGNAQSGYGADVISRIQAAEEGRLGDLTGTIRNQLNDMIDVLCETAQVNPAEICRMAVAANTTMCHLLAGLDPKGLGAAPFTPQSLFGKSYAAAEFGLRFDGEVYVFPAAAGFVGGDITADILAAGMDCTDKVTLLIDVGTNGEMVLGCGGRFVCCSAAAGPAFEGAQIDCGMTAAPGAISSVRVKGGRIVCDIIGNTAARGICGSGLIDAVAVMLELEAVDETGRMMDIGVDAVPAECRPYLDLDEDGEPIFCLTDEVYVSQSDVRRLQLGKGAIAAGTRVLMQKCGIEAAQIEELLLAGGFGSFIRVSGAVRIGLIPKELADVTRAIGNAAAEGAHAALLSEAARRRSDEIRNRMEYCELSGLAAFNEAYLEAMTFPEK